MLIGDFNINLWNLYEHEEMQSFLNTLTTYFIALVINCPTRVTYTTATLINNISSNFNLDIISPAIVINDLSDHFSIITWFGHETSK